MRHEKIITQPDGSKIKIEVSFYLGNDRPCYRASIWKAEKGKRTFRVIIDTDSYTFRALSMEDRRASEQRQVIEIIGADNYNEALKECWQKLEPKYI